MKNLAPGRFATARDHQEDGFSLIELMVVMVLIGIMAAMIVPEMRGTYQDALLRSSSRELVNVFGLAYSRAVSLNQLHRVMLDSNTGRYMVEKRVSQRESPTGFAPVRDIPGVEGRIDRRIAIEIRQSGEDVGNESEQGNSPAPNEPGPNPEAQEGIAFYPDGTADGKELLLRDLAGFRLVLQINPVTARVQILEPDRR